ncbi:hypothetical protein GGS20DRAFT_584054 [Poronia punctata]|nr:hypothetical protein GGS20DRAFT_584054 [Poronia punctata]
MAEHPLRDLGIPTGAVTARLRQFQQGLQQRKLEERRGSKYGNTQFLERSLPKTPDFLSPPENQQIIAHSCGRSENDKGHASSTKESRVSPLLWSQPSCRKSYSIGHLCGRFGHSEVRLTGRQHLSSSSTKDAKALQGPPSLVEKRLRRFESSSPERTTKLEKWLSAQDMFAQHNISRPVGWLSDLGDIPLSGAKSQSALSGDTSGRYRSVEQLSPAVEQKGPLPTRPRNNNKTNSAPSKAGINPFTIARPVSRLASFQLTRGDTPHAHPHQADPSSTGERSGLSGGSVLTDHQSHDVQSIWGQNGAQAPVDTGRKKGRKSRSSSVSHEPKTPKRRLTSPPPWLKTPTKGAADATRLLHHVIQHGARSPNEGQCNS